MALSTLAVSYLFRDTMKRRGQEAERRLGQLKALEDDPCVWIGVWRGVCSLLSIVLA